MKVYEEKGTVCMEAEDKLESEFLRVHSCDLEKLFESLVADSLKKAQR